MSILRIIDQLVQDVRYAVRGLRQNFGFAAAVTLILALGIGANTAVFSVINSLVLKPLPVEKPGELVRLARPAFSYPIVQQFRARGQALFSSLFGWTIEDVTVAWNQEPEMVQALVVDGEFYATLGVRAIRGRTFTDEDEVGVISYDTWERRFGKDPGVVGKVVQVGRLAITIIGVTPEGFFGVAPGMAPEITIPLRSFPKVKPEESQILRQSAASLLHVMARLKPGVTLTQANSALQVFWPQVMEAVTDPNMPAARRARFLSRMTELESASSGFSRVRNGVFGPLLILFALAGLLLAVACATVANLLLARAAVRQQEMAVRFAVGASRVRIIGQLLTEGLVLSALGGLGGLLVATWGSAGLITLLSTADDPIRLTGVLDGGVLIFTLALSVMTAMVFALAPAFRAARLDVAPALKDDSRSVIAGRKRWLGRSLVVVQLGLSMILVAGAALFIRSLNLILSQDAGFDRQDLLVVTTDAASAGYEESRLVTFYEELLDRLRTQPGVQSVSLSMFPPISGTNGGAWTESVGIDGSAPQQARENMTYFNPVSSGFFRTVGIPLMKGRDFGPQDNYTGPKTVIVNESFARAFFPNQDPIGHHVSVGLDPSRQNLEIVGVAQDAKYQNLQEPARRIAYQPWLQLNNASNVVIEVRAPIVVAKTVRAEIRSIDAAVPVTLQTAEDRIRESVLPQRVIAILSACLGGVALLLASAGLYGLMAYQVSRRTSEIGLRMALGASGRNIVALVLRESLVLAGSGVALGLAASIALGRIVRGALFGITSTDPIALAAAVLVMGTMALLAGYLPARRASRVDPSAALRQQ